MVTETARLMEIQKNSRSAFILYVHHLLGWKESPRSWRKLCRPTDETASVGVCVYRVCADSVSVSILKGAPLSERPVKRGYTQDTQTPKNQPKKEKKKKVLIRYRPHGLNQILSEAPSCVPVFLSFPHCCVVYSTFFLPAILTHPVSMSTDGSGLVMTCYLG